MNITRIRRGVLVAAIGAGVLAPTAALSAGAGSYAGVTGQGRQISFTIGSHGRVDMSIDLAMRCASGDTYKTATQTDPGDHFKVGPRGRFRVFGGFSKPSESSLRGARTARGHFKMVGHLRNGAIHGVVYEYDDIYNARGDKIDQCVDYIHTFTAHRVVIVS